MAVLSSTARDKKSDFVDDIIEEDEDKTKETDSKYSFAKVKSLDLNQFFNFFNPYYYYTGTGTTPFDCNVMTEWIVNQDVEYMNQKQLRQIQLARLNRKDASGSKSTDIYQNGNARIVNDRIVEKLNIMRILKKTVIMYKIFFLLKQIKNKNISLFFL